MKPKPRPAAAQDGPLKVDRPFDDAITRALSVKPPAGGWAAYEAKLKADKAKAEKPKKTG
ncbi:hypothetical protein [Phenylobacterium zucineum]|uniref:hypothetical protein n=1 Tax=Phenylobacterium zucineum TaxID=284016 RepID=UPI0003103648|nr:hypothetical protein [Phenylobacterium zucineum]